MLFDLAPRHENNVVRPDQEVFLLAFQNFREIDRQFLPFSLCVVSQQNAFAHLRRLHRPALPTQTSD